MKHNIDTGDHRLIEQTLRRHPPSNLQTIREQTEEMLWRDLIEPVVSEWTPNVVLVVERFALCVFYWLQTAEWGRRIDSCFDAMAGAKLFSTFDFSSRIPSSENGPCYCRTDNVRHMRGRIQVQGHAVQPRRCTCNLSKANGPRYYPISIYYLKMCLVYLDDIISFRQKFQNTWPGCEQCLNVR